MGERTPRNTEGAGPPRETQLLNQPEMVVYEALATLRRPMDADALVATTGLDEDTVRAALGRLTELGMIVNGEGGAGIGPNGWDVRGAQ